MREEFIYEPNTKCFLELLFMGVKYQKSKIGIAEDSDYTCN